MKTMIIKPLMVLLFLNIACEKQHSLLIDTENLKSVEVDYVYLRISTPVAVDCADFNQSFDDIKSRTLTSNSEWGNLIKEINRLIQKSEATDERADVRVKITLHYSDKTLIVCTGNNVTSINRLNFVNDEIFRNFILTQFKD